MTMPGKHEGLETVVGAFLRFCPLIVTWMHSCVDNAWLLNRDKFETNA